MEIEGEPYVVEMLNVLGDAADSEANAREALVAKSGDIMKNCIWMR